MRRSRTFSVLIVLDFSVSLWISPIRLVFTLYILRLNFAQKLGDSEVHVGIRMFDLTFSQE